MGIYDREYYRRDGPSFLGAFGGTGQVCKWLIIINVIAFVVQLLTRPDRPRISYGWFTDFFILDTDAVLRGQVWRLLTYAFLHDTGGLMHILFNMLFLWWFGKDVEDVYGSREFLAIYLVSALLGGLAFVIAKLLDLPGSGAYCLGASGAVTAVLVLCALHYPSRIILLFFILPVPIWLVVIFQVAQDLYGFLSGNPGNTAVTVHLAGAGFAYLYFRMNWRLLNLLPDLRSWQRRRAQPRLRIYREEEPSTPVSVAAGAPSPEADEHFEAKVDAVLEKMARSGKDSLTESERQILLRASEIYRRRRH